MACNSNEKNNHKDNEDCRCGDDCKCNHDETKDIIYLTLDNGEDLKCQVLEILRVEEKEYIVLLPEGEKKAYIYGYKEIEGRPKLSMIEDDDEFERISEIWLKL